MFGSFLLILETNVEV